MRHHTLLCAVTGALATVLLASPAPAMPQTEAGAATDARRAGLSCNGAVLGVTEGGRVVQHGIENGEVTYSLRSRTELPFHATGLGYRSSGSTDDGSWFLANVTATDGVPRKVRITRTDGSDRMRLSTGKYDQKGFEPKLFADGGGYWAYTLRKGTLARWSLSKFGDGDVRYAGRVVISSGYGRLRSLSPSVSHRKPGGALREYTYATTRRGELIQLSFEHKNPARHKLVRLADSGFEGVTEMAFATCNGKKRHAVLYAVDPETGTATWTTVRNAFTDPVTRQRGEVTGPDSINWNLTAAY